MRHLTMFASGVLFAVGLVVAGMTQPAKVIGFLDVTGEWDPSLAFVMLGAIGVYFLLHRLILGRSKPLFASEFGIPKRRDLDRRLIAGSALFGLGWGLAGYCPGPGLVALGSRSSAALVFVVAMLAGMFAFGLFERALARQRAQRARRDPSREVVPT